MKKLSPDFSTKLSRAEIEEIGARPCTLLYTPQQIEAVFLTAKESKQSVNVNH